MEPEPSAPVRVTHFCSGFTEASILTDRSDAHCWHSRICRAVEAGSRGTPGQPAPHCEETRGLEPRRGTAKLKIESSRRSSEPPGRTRRAAHAEPSTGQRYGRAEAGGRPGVRAAMLVEAEHLLFWED